MKLQLTSRAQKELDKIDDKIALKISQKIYQLENNPYGLDNQKLAGGKGYRIRVGDYRVVYIINKQSFSANKHSQTITIVKIRHRREVHR